MTRRLLSASMAVALLLCACSSDDRDAADPTQPSSEVTNDIDGSTTEPTADPALPDVPEGYLRFVEETAGADPTAQQALDWLVSATGLEIPGASAVYGDLVGQVGSLTSEIRWLTMHWRSLGAEQQAALQAVFARPSSGASGLLQQRPSDVVDDARAIVDELIGTVSRLTGVTIDRLAVSVREIPQVNLDTALAGTNPASLDDGFVPEEGRDWLGGDSTGYCDIMVGSLFARSSRTAQRGALAHELTHCAVIQRYDYMPPRTPAWYDEGGTAFAGEVAVSDSTIPFGPSWWSQFFGGNKLDTRGRLVYSALGDTKGYSAIGLFASMAETRGADVQIREWVDHFADPNRLDWLLGGAVGSAARANNLARYATSSVRQGWGPRWTMPGVNLANHGAAGAGRTQHPVAVAPNVSQAISLGSGTTDVVGAFRLDPAPSVDLLAVQLIGFGGVTAHGRGELIATGAPVTQVFCIGPSCECREPIAGITPVAIDRGVSPVVAIAGDLGAGPVIGIQGYDLPDDGSCNPCPAAAAPPASGGLMRGPAVGDPICAPDTAPPVTDPTGADDCAVGTWNVDNPVMAAVFQRTVTTATPGAPPTDFVSSEVTGSWTLVLGADGSMTMTASNWALTGHLLGPGGLGSDEPVPIDITITFNGTVTGRYSASNGSMTFSETSGGLSAKATGTVMGQTFDATTPQLANLPIAGNSSSTYTCGGGVLVLTPTVANSMPMTFTAA